MILGLFRRSPNVAVVERLHAAIVAAARQPALYTDLAVPDTFEGRFESLTLHAGLVLRRLRDAPAPGPEMAQDLVDTVFRHFDRTLREMGVGDTAVPKRMKGIAEAFAGRCAAYDEALRSGDLARALARNVYEGCHDGVALSRYSLVVGGPSRRRAAANLAGWHAPFARSRRPRGIRGSGASTLRRRDDRDRGTPMKSATQGSTFPSRSRAFSHPLDVAGVPAKGIALSIEPAPSQYPAIAAECGVPAVALLRANCKVMPRAGGRIEVTGDVAAHVTQTCVVSLEPFESEVTGPIEVTFAPSTETLDDWFEAQTPRRGRREEAERGARRPREAAPSAPLGDDQPDAPDPIIDGRIDLGAIALEFLVLALDPYPRKPGVTFDGVVAGDDVPEPGAFAGLAQLKDRT